MAANKLLTIGLFGSEALPSIADEVSEKIESIPREIKQMHGEEHNQQDDCIYTMPMISL